MTRHWSNIDELKDDLEDLAGNMVNNLLNAVEEGWLTWDKAWELMNTSDDEMIDTLNALEDDDDADDS